MRPGGKRLTLLCGALFAWSHPSRAQAPATSPDDLPLTKLSLQELRSVEVTSVSRKEESLLNAPSAVYVLDPSDVLRSGVTSIPEALRMVPGLNVAQINANKWAISSRGFNSRFANKSLVLIDGRTVYTPVFSGVYWDAQDLVFEDLDRIEVIRGPGGSLWGANAVNGVINIVTKDARETQGVLLTAGGGTEEQGFGALRYGGTLAPDWYYRVYAKGSNRDDFRELNGSEGADEWWQQREGFRVDWTPSEDRHLTLQGDFYYGCSGDRVLVATPTAPFSALQVEQAKATGGNLLARWTQELSSQSDYSLQVYYDRNERENVVLDAELDTLDFDFQHRFRPVERHEIIWGAGYRLALESLDGTFNALYIPDDRQDQLLSAFLQDEIALLPDRVFLTLGTKFEHNDYTGWEIQPSARLRYSPTERQTLWASVSRAVRTPAIFEHSAVANVALPNVPGVIARINGTPEFVSEELIAYEAGYRLSASESLFFDLSLFFNDYDRLRTSERGTPQLGVPVYLPITYGNELEGTTYGLEFAPSWQVTDSWRLSAGYTLLQMDLHRSAQSTDLTVDPAGDSPQNQFHLRSFLNLPRGFQFDSALYYVDSLRSQHVPSYVRLDVRFGWIPRQNLELSVACLNLLDPSHPEFGSSALVTPTEIERSIYGKVTWRF